MNEPSELPIAVEPPVKVNPYRIKLRHVLYIALVLIASSLAFGPWFKVVGYPHRYQPEVQEILTQGILPGLGVAAFWTVVWAFGFTPKSFMRTACYSIVLFIAIMLLRPPQGAREASRGTHCRNNLKQIGLAFHNYHDQYGSFPPAYVADEHGKPMHSWRVLILPFIDQKNRYDQYRFDEPWDSPSNQKLAENNPVYRCLSTFTQTEHADRTSYLAVIGPQTIWPGSESRKISEITDGIEQTVMVIEVPEREVHWMEPRDISFDELLKLLTNREEQYGDANYHNFHLLKDDGAVSIMPDVTAATLKAYFTINAGDQAPEIVPFPHFDHPKKTYRAIAGWSFFILALVPLLWIRYPGSSAVGRPSLSNPLR